MFLHALGLALHKSVQELSELSMEELESWRLYNEISPFDDLRRVYVPTAMVVSAMNGEPPNRTLDVLIPGWDDGTPETAEDVEKAFT